MTALAPLSTYEIDLARQLLGRLDGLVQELRAEGQPRPIGLLRAALVLDVPDVAAARLHPILVAYDLGQGVDLPRLARRALDILNMFEPAA